MSIDRELPESTDPPPPPVLRGELTVSGDLGTVPVTATLVLAGQARQVSITTSEPIGLLDLWKELLGYFGIDISPHGVWAEILGGYEIQPFITLSSETTASGKSSAVSAGIEFSGRFPQIGGTWPKGGGPLSISITPHIKILALYLSYDEKNGVGFRAKVLFLDSADGGGGGALENPESKPTPQILEYPFPLPPEKKSENPSFELRYFGLGQRFGPELDIDAPDPMAAALTALEDQLTATDPQQVLTDLVRHYYHPDRGWYVGIDLLLRGFRIRVIFNDPVLYGLEITGYDEPLKGLKFEIIYQKLGPHLGVYFGSLTIPDKFRTIQLGAASLTIPSFSIWIYTNGDFKVSVGWPLGTNSLVIQASIFMGGGGFYFAKLRSADIPGATGADKTNYNPVIEFGLAVFLGVGRSISAGPLSAELSLTMQGTFQGVLAWKALADGKSASISRSPDNYWFAASVGLVGVLEGSIDLVIIKVSVSIRISVTVGVAFQLGYKTPVVVSALVSVRASVKVLFFTIHITFKMHFTHTFVIGSGSESASMDGPLGDLAPFQPPKGLARTRALAEASGGYGVARFDSPTSATLHLDGRVTGRYLALDVDPSKDLTLTFVLHPTVIFDDGAGVVAGVAQLFMDAPAPTDGATNTADTSFEKLVAAYETFLLSQWPTWTEVQAKLGQGQDDAPDGFADMIDGFFDEFSVTIEPFDPGKDHSASSGDQPTPSVAVFPMWPKLMIIDPVGTTHFSPPGAPTVPVDYDQVLSLYYKKLADFDLANHGPAKPNIVAESLDLSPGPESLAQKVFADYFLLLGRQLAVDMIAEAKGDISLADHAPDPTKLAARLASMGSRYLLHGQRLPDPAKVLPNIKDVDLDKLPIAGLYALTGQQFEPADPKTPYEVRLELDPAVTAPTHPIIWGSADPAGEAVTASVTSTLPAPPSGPLAPPQVRPDPTVLPPLTSHPLWYAVRNRLSLTGPPLRSIVPLPEPLLDLAGTAGGGGLGVGVSKQAPDRDGKIAEQESVTAALVVKIKLERIKRPGTSAVDGQGQTSTYVEDVYQLIGTDDETMELIDRFLLAPEPPGATAVLAYSNGSELVPVDGDPVLAKVSLATTSQPGALSAPMKIIARRQRVAALGLPDLGPASAPLSKIEDFLLLVWEASVVNSPGFMVHADIPESVFGASGTVEADIVVLLGAPTESVGLTAYTNALVVDGADAPFVNVTGRARCLPTYPAGAVGFEFATDPLDPTDDPYAPATLSSLYTLYEFQLQAGVATPPIPSLGSSLWSQAMGPSSPDPAPDEETTARDTPAPEPVSNRYQRAVPIYGFVTDPVPPPRPGLAPLRWQSLIGGDPAPRNNRYAAAGASASIEIVPVDVFGNRLASAAATTAFPVEYHDPLIPVDEWPGTKLVYEIKPAVSHGVDPTLELTPTFSLSDVFGRDQIVIAAPSGGAKVNTPTITVAGTVRNIQDTVEIVVSQAPPPDGAAVAPAGAKIAAPVKIDGTWSAEVTLQHPDNLITVTATPPPTPPPQAPTLTATVPVTLDPHGGTPPPPPAMAADTFLDRAQTAIARYAVVVDQLADPNTSIELYSSLVAPAVAIIEPADGSVVTPGGDLSITGIVQDPTAKVTVKVGDGPPQPATVAADGSFSLGGLEAPAGNAVELTAVATPASAPPSTAVITVYCGTSACAVDGHSVPGQMSKIAAGSALTDPLYDFVADAIAQLEAAIAKLLGSAPHAAVVSGADAPNDPAPPISIALSTASLTDRIDDVFMVGAYLRLRRTAHVSPTAAVELPDVASVASPIAPNFLVKSGQAPASVTLREFALVFEQAFDDFDGAGGMLKLASRPHPGSGSTESTELWAVRWGASTGIAVTVPNAAATPPTGAGAPVYFAPAPLSTALLSGAVSVPRYDEQITPTDVLKTFSDIDLDAWARDFVADVGTMLSPAWVTAAAELSADDYAALMSAKAVLAESIAKSLTWTFVDQMGDTDGSGRGQPVGDRARAIDRFEQELLSTLGSDYTTSAIVQVPVEVAVAGVTERHAALPPRLFGTVTVPTITIVEPPVGRSGVSGPVRVAGVVDHRVDKVELTVGGQPASVTLDAAGRSFSGSAQIPAEQSTRIEVSAEVGGVCVATASVTVNAKGDAPELPPAKEPGATRAEYVLSTAQLPLTPDGANGWLNFVVSAPDAGTRLQLPLNYRIGNLEHRFEPKESKFGYVPSSWLTLVLNGPTTVFDVSLGNFEIPLPLRSYPALPVLVEQGAAATRPTRTGILDVTITSPAAGNIINASSTAVEGTVSGAGALTDLIVRVNGSPATVSPDGSFRLADLPVQSGTNTIGAVATAIVGGASKASSGGVELTVIGIAGPSVERALDEVLRWNYQVTIGTDNDPHDELWIETQYNVPLPNMASSPNVRLAPWGNSLSERLFTTMAQFRSGFADLEPVLEKLPDVAFKSGPSGEREQVVAALTAAVGLVTNVADAWTEAPPTPELVEDEPLSNWFIVRYPDAGRVQLTVFALQTQSESAPPFPTIGMFDPDTRQALSIQATDPTKVVKDAPPLPPDVQSGTWYESTYTVSGIERLPRGLPMSFTWSGLHLLETQSATAECFIVRNADLVPGRATNPEFVYTTPTVSFASPASPSADVRSFGPLPWEGTVAATIGPVFSALASAEVSLPKVVKVAASYEWTAVSGQGGFNLTNKTAALMTPSQPFSQQTESQFANDLANRLAAWRDLVAVPATDATLVLAITMFATIKGSNVPLVTMREVSFDLAADWWTNAV